MTIQTAAILNGNAHAIFSSGVQDVPEIGELLAKRALVVARRQAEVDRIRKELRTAEQALQVQQITYNNVQRYLTEVLEYSAQEQVRKEN